MKISMGEICSWKIDDAIATKLKLLSCCSTFRKWIRALSLLKYTRSNKWIYMSFVYSLLPIDWAWWIFQSATIFIREKLSLIHRWSLNIWKNFDRDVWHNRSRRLNTICNYIQTKQTSKINNTRVFTYPRCTISTNCSIQFPNVTSLV